MPDSRLSEEDWLTLLRRIRRGNCVPFLGAGAAAGALPLGGDIARDWAQKYGYPLSDSSDLIRVAQFVAVQTDPTTPKELILERLASASPPDFRAEGEPHGVLAELPLPVYLTTNYDDFMVRALKGNFRDPRREASRWNDLLRDRPSIFEAIDFRFHPASPVVYHLHGHTDPDSIVLTEDDYLAFLADMQDPGVLPLPLRSLLARSTLVFLGYRLADWNIRVLLQGLRKGLLKNMSVAVLLPPEGPDADREKEYLAKYYARMLDLRVFWGTAREFCAELGRRWKESPDGR